MIEIPAGLSDEARLAMMSLEEHPELNTPEAISAGPLGIQQVDATGIEQGLRELEARKLAVQTFGGWFLVK